MHFNIAKRSAENVDLQLCFDLLSSVIMSSNRLLRILVSLGLMMGVLFAAPHLSRGDQVNGNPPKDADVKEHRSVTAT